MHMDDLRRERRQVVRFLEPVRRIAHDGVVENPSQSFRSSTELENRIREYLSPRIGIAEGGVLQKQAEELDIPV